MLYQSFSRREVHVALLDARAGSPPKALTLLRRCSEANDFAELARQLAEWEEWCAELLESHLSYPVLAWYRSQHEHQSWLASLTLILDVSALLLAGGRHELQRGARLTFAMARHAAVDLAQAFSSPDGTKGEPRLHDSDTRRLYEMMSAIPVLSRHDSRSEERLVALRGMYEPYVGLLASYLLMPLPGWLPTEREADDWMTSAWETEVLRLPELE